ncbi:glycoside hydrolase [Methylocystis sp. ATCC 49242]|uniref:family 4 glycosyl hydrolase n=1 Tax=Methylocystis sp. ATCC 49242 TaxID=622637 RepID=UPI0001F86A83|nr:glycoside hydrolase [Methylocystis sp. ATCC 49242]
MARIKIAYVGGGSTRAPGTLAALINQGENFAGSEIVLIDLEADRLAVVKLLAERMARCRGLELTISATTERRGGLMDCDVVLTCFRPGGFQARYLDESIPLRHGFVGQETQGPGGLFLALRSVAVMKEIIADLERVAPRAMIINYTNPANIVSQAVSENTTIPIVSLCGGPISDPAELATAAGLDPARLDVRSIGLNHASWSIRHRYDDQDIMPLLAAAWKERRDDAQIKPALRRMWRIALATGSIPSKYAMYYYFTDEILAELRAKPTTRAQDIMGAIPDYWAHYLEQAKCDCPELDPNRSRRPIKLAIDVIDAIFNDRRALLPVNVPNRSAIPGFPDELVVETLGVADASGVAPLAMGTVPVPVTGLVHALAEYQMLAARAAWDGSRRDAIQALLANPLSMKMGRVEALYDEMVAAHKEYVPERLLNDR